MIKQTEWSGLLRNSQWQTAESSCLLAAFRPPAANKIDNFKDKVVKYFDYRREAEAAA